MSENTLPEFDFSSPAPQQPTPDTEPKAPSVFETDEVIQLSTNPDDVSPDKLEALQPSPEKTEQAGQPEKQVHSDPPANVNPTAQGIYQVMYDRGYIPDDMEFDGSFESLDNIFQTMPQLVYRNLVSSLPEPVQTLIDYGARRGNVTREDLANFFQEHSSIPDASQIDLSSQESQRAFVSSMLQREGQSLDDVQDILDLWESKGKLDAKANEYLMVLDRHKKEMTQRKLEEAEQYRQRMEAEKQEFIVNVANHIDQTGWTERKKQQVLNEIISGNMRQKSQMMHQHPVALYQMADFMTYYDPKSGSFDLDAYSKNFVGESTRKVKNTLETYFATTPQSSPFSSRTERTSAPKGKHDLEFAD